MTATSVVIRSIVERPNWKGAFAFIG
jgi:hypothetical protein